jgi:hypothetical protein
MQRLFDCACYYQDLNKDSTRQMIGSTVVSRYFFMEKDSDLLECSHLLKVV